MVDSVNEYKLMKPVLVNRGDSLIGRNVVLAVLWLVSVLLLAIPVWLLITAELPIGLGLGIFAGLQLAGLAFYIPLILIYKNNGFRGVSDGETFSWAIYRRRTIAWNSITKVSIINLIKRMDETPSLSFKVELSGVKKPVKLYFEEKSGRLFEQELKNRSLF